MKFTHDLDINEGWRKTAQISSDYKEVKHLGECTIDGDMFAAYNNQGEIHIFKGVLEEPLKTDTWYRNKHTSSLVYRKRDFNNYGIVNNEESNSLHCCTPEFWQEGTKKEVKEALIKLAKKKGFKHVFGYGFKIKSLGVIGNEFTFENNILFLDGVEIFKNGEWAEILEEEEPLKTDTWYRDKHTSLLVYRTGGKNNYGILDNIEGNNFSCFMPQTWQEATKKEVKEALIKLAKKKGFNNIGELKLKLINGKVFKKGEFIFGDNEFRVIGGDTLLLDGVRIFDKGKWAEILEEPIEQRLKRLEDKLL